MRRLAILLLWLWAGPGLGQEFSALARLDVAQSRVSDVRGGTQVDLWLSQTVPWRVFTLQGPPRVVLDFREVDWSGAREAALRNSDCVEAVRFGRLRPGWSRMVMDLSGPMTIDTAGMTVDDVTGTAHLQMRLEQADKDAFADRAGAPPDPGWDALMHADVTRAPAPAPQDGVITVAIDPGHGGIDPGAQRAGVREADVMLNLALDLATALERTDGMRPVLTRSGDYFVPLQQRMTLARAAGADVLISLHADALEAGQAAGASVYVLDAKGKAGASDRMAQRHDRRDLLAGVDLQQQDDTLAMVLMDLARSQTGPQSTRLQSALIEAFAQTGARLNTRPARSSTLAVLMAADFPSVLLEAGFLSNPADRAALQSPQGRAPLVAGIILGLRAWAAGEEALAPLMRK